MVVPSITVLRPWQAWLHGAGRYVLPWDRMLGELAYGHAALGHATSRAGPAAMTGGRGQRRAGAMEAVAMVGVGGRGQRRAAGYGAAAMARGADQYN